MYDRTVSIHQAMVLAAGEGLRLQPITRHCPKPLLSVRGERLIVRQLQKLKQAGITKIVINLCHLGDQIASELKTGSDWGLTIDYSYEPKRLETGGGIWQAIQNKLLYSDYFFVVSSDIYSAISYKTCLEQFLKLKKKSPDCELCCWLTENPAFNPRGDYNLDIQTGKLLRIQDLNLGEAYNYSNISIISRRLFMRYHQAFPDITTYFKLSTVINYAISQGLAYGFLIDPQCFWDNIGTIDQLIQYNQN